jgi:hypothetical protein
MSGRKAQFVPAASECRQLNVAIELCRAAQPLCSCALSKVMCNVRLALRAAFPGWSSPKARSLLPPEWLRHSSAKVWQTSHSSGGVWLTVECVARPLRGVEGELWSESSLRLLRF